MTSALYPSAIVSLLSADIDLLVDTIKVTLVDGADYTYSSAHDFYDDVAVAGRIATATLSSKSVTGGAFDAADVTFTSVTGDTSEILIIWKDTGVESTSPLIAYIDVASGGGGISVTPNGGNINVAWDNGTNKIFKVG